VRLAGQLGEIVITDHGRQVARIVPLETEIPSRSLETEIPYFARRKASPEFLALAGKLHYERDTTDIISEDRDAR
jgi:antitoxin (DNA-binding transcriptional repressor) of toxin-antitoxin stability system